MPNRDRASQDGAAFAPAGPGWQLEPRGQPQGQRNGHRTGACPGEQNPAYRPSAHFFLDPSSMHRACLGADVERPPGLRNRSSADRGQAACHDMQRSSSGAFLVIGLFHTMWVFRPSTPTVTGCFCAPIEVRERQLARQQRRLPIPSVKPAGSPAHVGPQRAARRGHGRRPFVQSAVQPQRAGPLETGAGVPDRCLSLPLENRAVACRGCRMDPKRRHRTD